MIDPQLDSLPDQEPLAGGMGDHFIGDSSMRAAQGGDLIEANSPLPAPSSMANGPSKRESDSTEQTPKPASDPIPPEKPISTPQPGSTSTSSPGGGAKQPAQKDGQARPTASPKRGTSGQQKRNSTAAKQKSPSRPDKGKNNNRTLPKVEGIRLKTRTPPPQKARRAPPEPGWVRRVQRELPPYADEMLAFLLIGIGLLSFFTLLSPSSGALGSEWSNILRQAFGIGAFAISATILVMGTLLLVPKLGVEVRLNWWRVIAGEFFYVFLLAFIHAGIRASVGGEAGEIEAFATAFEGGGGGVLGWAVQDLLHMLLGDVVTEVVLLILLVLSGGLMIGIRRQNIVGGLTRLRNWSIGAARRIEQTAAHADTQAEISQRLGGDAQTALEGRSDALTGPGATDPSQGPRLVELPPIPGRPSVVTGSTGAGALTTRPPASAPQRLSVIKRRSSTEALKSIKESGEIKYRFTVNELPDKKKIRKRSSPLPSLDLLDTTDFERPTEDEININAQIIEETVEDFGMQVEVVGVKAGPTVTQYAVQPFAQVDKNGEKIIQRVRVTRVAALSNDLSLALAAPRVRIQAPVPGTNYIGVEVPNDHPGVVSLRPVIESESFYKIRSPLAIALGREVDGTPFSFDLAAMPHLLVGGTTGSGKSVCITAMSTCLVVNNTPDDLRLIMIDPKMVELVRFNGLPHLLGQVEVQLDRIIGVLRWLTREMDRRYRIMEDAQARNIDVYNKGQRKRHRLPRIAVMIDELAELMTEYPDETEHLITRLAQMARATGIHLVVATQRPSTDIVTGLIKANFPARIAFAVASGTDSRVIIDTVGAEDLIGRGDMLFCAADAAGPIRLQGCFVTDSEMERAVEFWRTNWDKKDPMGDEYAPWERALTREAILDETDRMLIDAIRLIQEEQETSTSFLQRKLNVGYPRAGRIMDALYRLGAVGEEQAGGRTRSVLVKADEDPVAFMISRRHRLR